MPSQAARLLRSTHVSYSKLQAYERCPLRFKLEYIDECPPEPSRPMQLGTVVHAVIARYLSTIQDQAKLFHPKLSDCSKFIEPACTGLRDEDELTFPLSPASVVPLLQGFTELFPRIDGRAIRQIEAENSIEVGGYRLKSILDLVLADDDVGAHVIDFKTGKPDYVTDDQLRIYALCVLRGADPNRKRVKLSYAFLKGGFLHSFMMSRQECSAVEASIVEQIRVIEKDTRFEPRVSRLCRWCGVRDYCPAYDG